MDMRALREMYDAQAGVVSRKQLLEIRATDDDIRRLVRRKLLVRVHRGIYVNHTGPLSWANRAWAAVLFYKPAALCGHSALTPAGDMIHVAIQHPRNADPIPGVKLHRLVDLDRKVVEHEPASTAGGGSRDRRRLGGTYPVGRRRGDHRRVPAAPYDAGASG
jgi:hypothetical protein